MMLASLNHKRLSVAIALALFAGNAAATSIEDKIELLQQEIEALKDQVAATKTNKASTGIQSFVDNTTIGGYGNLNYNNFSGGATAKDQIDLQRFVLFFGHKFNDMVSFKSEFEIEHAVSSADDSGEAEVEQAYLDFHFNDKVNAKVGLFLIPAGLLNETHEPPTFFGVERNQIESRIIPTTWREAGVALYGETLPGLKYQVGITTGFSARKFDDPLVGIKSAHQEGQLADAEDLAFSAALNYTGINGLLVGGSVFTGNTGQNEPGIGDARLTLWDLHTRYQTGNWDLRALYARGHLNDAADITAATGVSAPSAFYGWFTEAAYHVWKSGDMDFAPFVRYESYDTQASLPFNSVRVDGSENKVWTVGANFWPTPQVVLKADFQSYDKKDEDRGNKRLNLGMGYMF
ncbi:porin [Methylotenera sp.]|uniref:porin n=1 Tax=Methylotenera sp. TaxID=2051956 RepID=UPI0024897923|nr:porin [Methylotenera sp.]MDI1362909.1 porin [Methylotenera sp.]